MLKIIQLNIVDWDLISGTPILSVFLNPLCCYDINSPDFESSKEHDIPRQKCIIGTAGNNMCGMNLIYPFPTTWLGRAVTLNHEKHESKCSRKWIVLQLSVDHSWVISDSFRVKLTQELMETKSLIILCSQYTINSYLQRIRGWYLDYYCRTRVGM